MYSVLIVDDEPYVRSLLRQLIDWETRGFKIAGEAGNGKQAVARCYERSFDLILTDIRMPGKDGIALMRELGTMQPGARIVVVSGYGEFEYAREAIRCGASDFLLKPVDEDALGAVVDRLRRDLDGQRRELKEHKELARKLGRFRSALASGDRIAETGSDQDDLVSRAMALIATEPSERRGLVEVADELGANPTYLSELFRRQAGIGFHEYGAALRFARAKELLENTDLLVKDISHSIGFSDPNYFVRCFRKRYGLSPTEFRTATRGGMASGKDESSSAPAET